MQRIQSIGLQERPQFPEYKKRQGQGRSSCPSPAKITPSFEKALTHQKQNTIEISTFHTKPNQKKRSTMGF